MGEEHAALSAMYVWLLGKIEPFDLVRYASRQKTADWAGHCVPFKHSFRKWIYWSNMGAINLDILVPKSLFHFIWGKWCQWQTNGLHWRKVITFWSYYVLTLVISVSLTSLGCDLSEFALLLFLFYLFFILCSVIKTVFSITKYEYNYGFYGILHIFIW